MPDPDDNPPSHRLSTKLVLVILLVIALVAASLTLPVTDYIKSAYAWIESLGFWAPLAFILFYATLTVFLVSGGALTLLAGGAFGLLKGTLIVIVASNLGAGAAFLIGRYLARDWVAKKIATHPTFTAIDQAVANDGWKIVALTRLSPVFPFVFLNYAFGLTKVRFIDYLTASIVGMLPGTIMYVYLGSLAKAGAESEGKSPGEWALYIIGLLATIAVTVLITKKAKAALNQKTQTPETPSPP
ncbi:MAG: TVP38/TMEM64 family protein [Verrucomicrobiota bacterium]